MTTEEAVAELKRISDLLPLEDAEVIGVVLAALAASTELLAIREEQVADLLKRLDGAEGGES